MRLASDLIALFSDRLSYPYSSVIGPRQTYNFVHFFRRFCSRVLPFCQGPRTAMGGV